MSEANAPEQPKANTTVILLQECFFCMSEGFLFLITAADDGRCLLPVFDSLEDLEAFMSSKDFAYDKVGKISNQDDFLNSLPRRIGIAHGARTGPDGQTHYNEIMRGS